MTKEVQAPGVARIGERWVLYYVALARMQPIRYCLSVATSDSPLGPFVDTTSGPIVCDDDPEGSRDPQPFVDDNGRAYLIWKSEGFPCTPRCEPPRIWSQPLTPEGTSVLPGTSPTELLSTNHPDPNTWEGVVIENPAMVRHEGRLVLFYAGNEWNSEDYATGYAECTSPVGPCIKRTPRSPLLANRGDILELVL